MGAVALTADSDISAVAVERADRLHRFQAAEADKEERRKERETYVLGRLLNAVGQACNRFLGAFESRPQAIPLMTPVQAQTAAAQHTFPTQQADTPKIELEKRVILPAAFNAAMQSASSHPTMPVFRHTMGTRAEQRTMPFLAYPLRSLSPTPESAVQFAVKLYLADQSIRGLAVIDPSTHAIIDLNSITPKQAYSAAGVDKDAFMQELKAVDAQWRSLSTNHYRSWVLHKTRAALASVLPQAPAITSNPSVRRVQEGLEYRLDASPDDKAVERFAEMFGRWNSYAAEPVQDRDILDMTSRLGKQARNHVYVNREQRIENALMLYDNMTIAKGRRTQMLNMIADRVGISISSLRRYVKQRDNAMEDYNSFKDKIDTTEETITLALSKANHMSYSTASAIRVYEKRKEQPVQNLSIAA